MHINPPQGHIVRGEVLLEEILIHVFCGMNNLVTTFDMNDITLYFTIY
jgi:hypothetical protein